MLGGTSALMGMEEEKQDNPHNRTQNTNILWPSYIPKDTLLFTKRTWKEFANATSKMTLLAIAELFLKKEAYDSKMANDQEYLDQRDREGNHPQAKKIGYGALWALNSAGAGYFSYRLFKEVGEALTKTNKAEAATGVTAGIFLATALITGYIGFEWATFGTKKLWDNALSFNSRRQEHRKTTEKAKKFMQNKVDNLFKNYKEKGSFV